jgi:uncharacterized protein
MPPVTPGMDPLYLIIFGGAMLLSHLVGATLRRKFDLYSRMPLGISGRDIARRMLAAHGITGVEVTSTPGHLTDHYNPADRSVNLSEPVFHSTSVAAAAVAAHECGHAVQHARAYPMLQLRSNLVPVVQIGSRLAPWLLMAGLALAVSGGGQTILLLGILLFAGTTLFALVTLPVEFDASKRALQWLESSGIATGPAHAQAKDALFWAAMTYTVAALASIGQLLYFVMMFLNARNRE